MFDQATKKKIEQEVKWLNTRDKPSREEIERERKKAKMTEADYRRAVKIGEDKTREIVENAHRAKEYERRKQESGEEIQERLAYEMRDKTHPRL